MSAIAITIYPLSRSRYRVEYLGATLVSASDEPALDACRALVAKGLRGTLRVYHVGAEYWSMQVDIEKGAKLRIVDNAPDGPRFGKWRPFIGISSETSSNPCGVRQGRPFSIGAGVAYPAPNKTPWRSDVSAGMDVETQGSDS